MVREEGFTNMENAMVIDSNDQEIGMIHDFTIDDAYQLKNFIVKRFDDPSEKASIGEAFVDFVVLIPLEKIKERTHKYVFLNVVSADLEFIEFRDIKGTPFETIRNASVIDSEGENVGRVIDVNFHKDDNISLVLGGSPFKEFIKRIGFIPSTHFLLPSRYISKTDLTTKIITMSKNKDYLVNSFNKNIVDAQTLREMQAQKLASKEQDIKIFSEVH